MNPDVNALMIEWKRHLLDEGWAILSARHTESIFEVKRILENQLKSHTGLRDINLENYGEWELSEEQHLLCHSHMTQFFRSHKLGRRVIEANLSLFVELIGPDINVQQNPYLRIARPGILGDNLDFHRDTFYGHTPYELSVLVPYVELSQENSLSMLSGSHIQPDREFPFTQVKSADIEKGSLKNQLGFLYAPKLLHPHVTEGIKPVSLQLGDILVFSQATIHGSRVNLSRITRWTSDTRIVNAFVPLKPELKPGYYEPLARSVVSQFSWVHELAERGEKSLLEEHLRRKENMGEVSL